MATIFTRIIQGEIPCYKIAEDEDNFAFLDINPNSEGHTLCGRDDTLKAQVTVHDDSAYLDIALGGPLGAYLSAEQLDTPLDYEAFAAIGAMIGHGGDDRSDCSSRRRHTRSGFGLGIAAEPLFRSGGGENNVGGDTGRNRSDSRSEERRVGKEGRSRWSPYH